MSGDARNPMISLTTNPMIKVDTVASTIVTITALT